MKKNVEIKKLGINGEGIGYIDRKIVFVPGALPQEEVIVEIIKQTRTYSEGKLLQVVNLHLYESVFLLTKLIHHLIHLQM